MIVIRGPRALYTKMLSDWLRWAPPKHPLPTSTALAAALRSDTVEEDLLASDIEKKFGGGEVLYIATIMTFEFTLGVRCYN